MDGGLITEYRDRNGMIESLLGTDYEIYLPETVRAGYLISGKKEVMSVREVKRLLGDKKITVSKKERDDSLKEDAVRIKNAWFRYERKGRDIIRDLDLCIKRGDFICLIGPNGSGKTTLMNLIAGGLKPYKGKVTAQGRVAMLPQRPVSLFIKNSVREDFENVSGNYMEHVRRFSLEDILERHPYDLSGGEIELCGVVKVLLTDPDIIILDEPTKGIDAACKMKLGRMLEELNREGKTVIIATHDMEFCARFAAGTTVMFDGDIVRFGKSEDILGGSYFYTTDVNRIFRDLNEKALVLEEVKIDER